MSQRLREFLAAYLAWVKEGAPHGDDIPFNRGYGLCYNIKLYVPDGDGWYDASQELRDEMAWLFKRDGLCEDYPFCTAGQYDSMSYRDTHHTCEARLAWIRKQLEASC